jgi:ribose transport system substrate-binding protein
MTQKPSRSSARPAPWRRLGLTTAVAVIGIGTLAGCSATGASVGGSGSSSKADDKNVVIGYSTYTVANPAFAGIIQGQEGEAKKFGYKFITANSNGDANQQIADVQNLITQGATYIVITPADGTAIAPAVKAADEAGIPVIAIADGIASPVTATFSMDHTEGGQLAGEAVVAALTKKYGKPQGNVVDLQGIAGTLAAAQRDKGFVDVLAKYPDITIVAKQDGGFDTDKSNAAMATILQAQPKIDAVYGANDAQTYGATAAIKAAGRFKPVGDPGHIYTIGIDGAKPAIDGIRDKSQDATVSQNFVKMGIQMVDAIHDKVSGKISKIESVKWPLIVIDTDNIDSEAVKNYGIWADEVK